MKKNTRDWHVRVASLVFLILAWSISSYFINSRLFPQPLNVIESLIYNILEGTLISDCYITLSRALSAFFISFCASSLLTHNSAFFAKKTALGDCLSRKT